jgi:hypothetical protein
VLGFRLNVSFSFLFMRIELCLVRLGRNVRNSIFFMINYFFSFSLLFFAKPIKTILHLLSYKHKIYLPL